MERYHWLPWLDRLLTRASAIVPANTDTKQLLEKRPYRIQKTMLDTGAPDTPITTAVGSPDGVFRMMYAGQLERRKGLELSLRALAKVQPGAETAAGLDRFDIVLTDLLVGQNRFRFTPRWGHFITSRCLVQGPD